jgi:hypothetical protein
MVVIGGIVMVTLKDILLQTNDDTVHLLLTDIHVEEERTSYNVTFKVHIKNHIFDVVSESLTMHSKHLIKFLHELSDLYFKQEGETSLTSLEDNLEIKFKYTYNGYIGITGYYKEMIGFNQIQFDYALDQTAFKDIKNILKETLLKIT